ncbi:MAG: prolyl oligopeptidase family serine peptidase [Pirellulaceae bacterium]
MSRYCAWLWMGFVVGLSLLVAETPLPAAEPPWTVRPTEVRYQSSADQSEQPAIFFAPRSEQPVPLVVALHSWSADYRQTGHQAIADWCVENGWAYIHPNFRGPNKRPEATGSELVVADIVSAVEYAQAVAKIDSEAVYLMGASGGGHASLLMAGRRPDLWAGVSAWVPISDLTAWHAECLAAGRKYHRDIVASCGGLPGESDAVDAEYRARSPLTHLAAAKGLELHIAAGIHDGHTGSVPISHTLRAFNEVAQAEDRLTAAEIEHFTQQAEVPPHLQREIKDPSYGAKPPLFRRISGKAQVTIFEGGHEMVPSAVIAWLEEKQRIRP